MKLTNLHPEWIDGHVPMTSDGGGPLPPLGTNARRGIGMICDCPCGKCDPEDGGRLYVPFANPLDGGPEHEANRPAWRRTGETFAAMTLEPSILRDPDKGGCGWHGWVCNGEAVPA